jgi:hypothetical protein
MVIENGYGEFVEDPDRARQKYSKKNSLQCHFFHHKRHAIGLESNPSSRPLTA